jgi:predicted RND superfamily exporter protein
MSGAAHAPPRRRLALARRTGLAVIALAVASVPFALRVGVDNRMELWVDRDGAAAARYARFRELFGSDEFLVVAIEGPGLEPESLEGGIAAAERLEALPGVRRVLGAPTLYRDGFAEGEVDALREELLATPFWRDFLVAGDGSVLGLFVETELAATPTARRELVAGVSEALSPLEARGLAVHVAGPPVLNAALDDVSRREAARTFPLAFGLSLAVVGAALRSLRAALLAGACAGVTLLLGLGVVGLSGRPLNMVTSALPPLLWVLSLAGTIHLLERIRAHRGAGREPAAAVDAALADVALPTVVSLVTTALGFASLGAARMAPVRELGAFGAAGLLLAVPVALGLGPLLGLRLGCASAPEPPARARAFGALGGFASRHARAIAAAGVAAGLVCGAGILRLRVESDPLAFLPADSPTARAYRAVGERLTGFYSLETVLDVPGGWLDPQSWPALEALAARLAAEPGVARVLSPLDFLKQQVARHHGRDPGSYRLPADAREARALVEEFDAFGAGRRTGLVADDGRVVRLSALVRVMPSSSFLAIVDHAERAIAALPPPLGGYVTGLVLRLVDAQLALVDSQIRSFGLAVLTIFGCVGLGLRSVRLLALAIPPNLLPVLAALAAMGFFDVALDAATVMMASVALGIAVDDTVHLLGAWRRERHAGLSGAEAVRAALVAVGPAMVLTTVASSVGFLALTRSAFVPLRWFGLLSAVALVAALATELLLTPALLSRLRPEGRA